MARRDPELGGDFVYGVPAQEPQLENLPRSVRQAVQDRDRLNRPGGPFNLRLDDADHIRILGHVGRSVVPPPEVGQHRAGGGSDVGASLRSCRWKAQGPERGHERVCRQFLGVGGIANAGEDVPVDTHGVVAVDLFPCEILVVVEHRRQPRAGRLKV
jgi:hypothetical protein